MTITEGLARIKTLTKRIEKKQEFVLRHIGRASTLTDPLAEEGGSLSCVSKEMQAIHDLSGQIVAIRKCINDANRETPVSVNGAERTVEGWLVWKREVAPRYESFLARMLAQIESAKGGLERHNRMKEEQVDFIVHYSERDLADLVEKHQTVMAELDGQLSLVNATVQIAIPD